MGHKTKHAQDIIPNKNQDILPNKKVMFGNNIRIKIQCLVLCSEQKINVQKI